MTDQEAIEKAYHKALENIFLVFLDAYITANGQQELQEAIDRFETGLAHARTVRSIALSLL